MEKSGFFNSVNGDRKYKAEFFAEYFASFIGNGVFPNPSDNLQVISNNDMTVTLKAGSAWINGYYYANDSDLILTIENADGVLNRIDRIVLQYSTLDREIKVAVKKGTFGSSPVAPDLQRDADIYELGIADIAINAGVVSITQANITDLRLDNAKCGIVHGTIEQVDTTTLFNQYLDWYNQTKSNAEIDITTMQQQFESEFNTWFTTIQNALSGDVAGNLLNKINDLAGTGRTTETVKGNANSIVALEQSVSQIESDTAAQMADLAGVGRNAETVKGNADDINILNVKLENYNSYASNKDANGIYTVLEYKKSDGTLYSKSTLSNPDTNGNYQTVTWEFYNEAGDTVIDTKIWTITYDVDGGIVSKVVT